MHRSFMRDSLSLDVLPVGQGEEEGGGVFNEHDNHLAPDSDYFRKEGLLSDSDMEAEFEFFQVRPRFEENWEDR